MLSMQVTFDSANGMGLVWFLRDTAKATFRFGHGGAHMFGWTNNYLAYPRQDFAVAVFTNQWPIRGLRYPETDLIAAFISSWLEREAASPHPSRPMKSWTWKTSYVAGLTMVEQLKGMLGIVEPLTPEMVNTMAHAHPITALEDGVAVWDEAGFRAGVADMLSIKEFSQAEILAFLKSDRLQVLPEELELLNHELGLTGAFTLGR